MEEKHTDNLETAHYRDTGPDLIPDRSATDDNRTTSTTGYNNFLFNNHNHAGPKAVQPPFAAASPAEGSHSRPTNTKHQHDATGGNAEGTRRQVDDYMHQAKTTGDDERHHAKTTGDDDNDTGLVLHRTGPNPTTGTSNTPARYRT